MNRNDLVTLAAVAGRPVRPAEAAAVLGGDTDAVIEAVEALAAEGVLTETPAGFRVTQAAEVSTTRRAEMAGRWADHLEAAGAPDGELGRALIAAGRPGEALPHLTTAADQGDGDAAGLALDAHDESGGLEPATEGRLRLIRARRLRGEGRSAEAADDVDVAVRRLDGDAQIDALGFAAAIADDRQQPQRSEVMAAMAAERAAHAGHLDKLGSILTLQGRSLSRIGFPAEGDAAQERGQALIDEHGHLTQQYYGRMNRAWVLLDRGEASDAEVAFARLRDDALDVEGEVGLADKEAYWARAAFRIGLAADAADAADRALDSARRLDAPAPGFIACLAMAEGALLYRRHEDALQAADAALALVRAHLPAWENVVAQFRARALAGLGRLSEAQDEIARALELCPPGADGWRWRMHCRAIQMQLLETSARWPQSDAEDLTDALLQARLYDAAAELMTERATRESDPELGEQAASLAVRLGNPALAAYAAGAGDMWDRPEARPIGRMVRSTAQRLPDGWWETWRTDPAVREAMDLPEPEPEDSEILTATIDEALAMAGLSGVTEVLSPAQRRSAGLVRRREVKRRRRWPAVAAAAVAVIGLSAATALGVNLLQADTAPEASGTTTTTMATTTTTRLEDRVVTQPEQGLFGESLARGGATRTGVLSGSGIAEPGGIYWRQTLAGRLSFEPVAYGQLLYLGVDGTDSLTFLDQSTGDLYWEEPVEGPVEAPPALTEVGGEGGSQRILAFTSEDGYLYFRAAQGTGVSATRAELPNRRRALGTPAVTDDGSVVVATDGGQIASYVPLSTEPTWVYPAEGTEPGAAFESAPAVADGLIYAIDAAGLMHVVDAVTGAALCPEPIDLRAPAFGGPIVAGDTIVATLESGTFLLYQKGACADLPASQVTRTGTVAVRWEPAVVDGVIVVEEARALAAYRLDDGSIAWIYPKTVEEGPSPVTAPVVAGGTVYVGTINDELMAFDAATGDLLWSFALDGRPAGPPAVVDGAVYVPLLDGTVVAIAGEQPG